MVENPIAKKLINILTSEFTVAPAPCDCLPEVYLRGEIENMIHAYTNEELKLQEKDLQFSIYKIIKEKTSELYFSEEGQYREIKNEQAPDENLLLVFVESKTGYFSTNSARLFFDLDVKIGVTEEDVTNNTMWYLEYISAQEMLQTWF
ncbi:MAG: hypothetical protein LBM95_00355 [Lactobacillales bacterium]|jgi:hypothetical protein|nr:hypothetical protein [Lactobacillales bacterium]